LNAFRITQKNNNPITFKKNQKGDWIMDDSLRANQLTIAAALAVFQKARMKFIPTKNAIEHIMAGIEKQGIQVEYLDDAGNTTKSYIIGSGAGKGDVTYFLMSGAEQPYAMEMSGFDGILRSRFDHLYENWRSPILLDENPSEIEKISVEYPKDRENSFVITKENSAYSVKPMFNTTTIVNKNINSSILEAYLLNFKSLYAEGFENRNERRDSIITLVPFVTMKVKSQGEDEKSFDFYPVLTGIDPNLNPTAYQEAAKINRYFTQTNWGDFMLTQQYVVGKYFVSYRSFFEN
jgi:hypothetical protein